MKLLFVFSFLTASALGQFSGVRMESEYAVNAAGKKSFQQYFWEDFKGTDYFLVQRPFFVEGGAKLLEAGFGRKFKTPLLKSVNVSLSTDGYIVTPFVFSGTIAGHRLTWIADHKGTFGRRPGFTFTKLYFQVNKHLVLRAEGNFLDNAKNNARKKGNWTTLQPGVEWQQAVRGKRHTFLAFEYDMKNEGPVVRLGARY